MTCWHVWRKRRTRTVLANSTNGLDILWAYPRQCVTCFLRTP